MKLADKIFTDGGLQIIIAIGCYKLYLYLSKLKLKRKILWTDH